MSIKRNGLKVLGLSLVAVLGLMAFMAVGAQAGWLIEKVEIAAETEVTAKAHTPGILTIAKKNIELKCTELGAQSLKLIPKTTAKGEIQFKNCVTISPIGSGTVQASCKPVEPIKASGQAKLILHPEVGGKNYVLFEPATGSTKFAIVEFPGGCALVETSEITGHLVVECGKLVSEKFVGGDCKEEEATHLVQPNETLFPTDTLNFGKNAATLKGIAAVTLAGANAGKLWAGHI
jgi:hypothetical protein